MICKDLAPLMASLGDGSLSLVDEKLARAHLEGCTSCRAALDRLEKLELLLGAGLAVPDPGEAYFQAQRERLLRAAVAGSVLPTPAEVRRPRRARFAWAAAAAILILAAGAGYWRGVPARAPEAGSTSQLPVRTEKPSLTVASPGTEPSVPHPEVPSPGIQSPAPTAKPPALPEPASVRPTTPGPGPMPALPAPSAIVQTPKNAPPASDPGASARLTAMTEEAVAIGLAETPRERVVALFGAAEARLGELGQVLRQDPNLASELAGAYLLLLGEGVRSVLADGTESPQELALARMAAREHARGHESTLLELGALAQGNLKGTLEEALAVSRELARP